ncbi:MAG: glycoside hydrolase family 95 protein, partial [Ferruginibacter sp.]
LFIQNATAVTIIITAVTDYNFSKLNFDRTINSKAICESIIQKAGIISFEQMKKNHLQEYQSLFSRMSLQLSDDNTLAELPTDARLELVKKGGDDPGLVAMYFQFGRYLLMSSSRAPGKLPANLQGVWNEHFNAPWESDYHTNINVQMNYWPAEVCNLSETTEPLFNFIDNYRIPGRVSAKKMYNANGWMMHHATDIFGKTGINAGINWGTSPLSASWLCQPLWEHYQFTQDENFLRQKAYPIMKEAAAFVQSFLIKDKNGYLVTAPSMSPENSYKLPGGGREQITYSPTIDIEMITDFYTACIKAANILQQDKAFADELKKTLQQLPPVKISKRYGTIQEWIEDYEETEPGHRHMSHLFGVHPGNSINAQTPELFAAAKKNITTPPR